MKRAVVIGSGMGGLVTARLLQMEGYDTTVLERHVRPGGLLHRFFRQGTAYDTGFHYCGSVAAGQPLGQILRHVGVFDDLAFHDLDPDGFDRLRFPDRTFDVPVGWGPYRDRLVEHFPHETTGIDRLLEVFRENVDAYGLYRMEATTDLMAVLDAEGALLMDVLRAHVRDPKLMSVLTGHAVLYGVRPSAASLGVHALILDHFLQGATSLKGGGDRLAMALTRKIRRSGGRVLLKHEVTEVVCEGRQATGVRTADGALFPADLVVSNLHPRLTLDLLPDSATRPAYRSRVASTPVGHGHLGVYLEVDGQVPELGNRNHYRHLSWSDEEAYRSTTPEGPGLYFAASPTQQLGGSERSSVLMVAPLDWSDVTRFGDTPDTPRSEAYLAYKEALLDGMVRRLVADHPTLEGRIVRREASTPLTTAHFTRSPHGAMYGHLHSRDQMGRMRPSARIRVRNMMLVGQGVFSPGVLGTALSAYYAMGHLFGLEPLLDSLRRA